MGKKVKRVIKKFLRTCGYELHSIVERKSYLENTTMTGLLSTQRVLNSSLFGYRALGKILHEFSFDTILDVGSGAGEHSRLLMEHGKQVTAVDLGSSPYYRDCGDKISVIRGNYLDMEFPVAFDAVWASHVLEHQLNVNVFLKKLLSDCREGGVVAVTVPPLKHEIVGGHLSLWNAGLLLYHLVIAGCDCRDASVLTYGYNISVVVHKKTILSMPNLCYDKGDIHSLLSFFPSGVSEPFDGQIDCLNW